MKRLPLSLAFLLLLLLVACGTPRTTAPSAAAAPTTPAAAPTSKDTVPAPRANTDEFRRAAPKPGPAPEIQLGDFNDFTLDNGLQVVLVENHKLPRVSYQLFVDVPPHLEGEYAGAQQLLGSMLRRATSEMSKEEIDEAIDFIGASLSTSGSGAYASTISKYKEDVIKLMADVILRAEFPEAEFNKVKADTKAGLAQEVTNPDAIANRVTQALTYGRNHPYGELMTEQTLENIDLDVVKSVYATYFVPNRSYLVMVGDLTPEEARALATEHFSSWTRKDVAVPTFPTPRPPAGVTVNFVPRTGSVQSNLVFSEPIALQPGTKESIRANLMNIALGSGFNGRLFANLREDKGYTYGAYSSTGDDPLVGNFRAYANVRNEVTDSAVTQFMYELKRMAESPLTEKELEDAKMEIAGSFGRALESPQRIASYALNTARYGLDRDFYPNYLKVVQNSSLNDVSEVARDLITPQNINLIVVGDKAVAEQLAQFATSGKVDFYDANGVPVDMQSAEVPADVTPEQILNAYFEAIGGKEAAMAVTNVTVKMEGDVQGQKISQNVYTTNDGRMSSQMSMMGMVMADQRYNKGKAMVSQQGQKMDLPAEAVEAMGQQAVIFQESAYLDQLDKITVEGSEMVNGKQALILAIETPAGLVREYYDASTKLKLQTIRQQGGMTVTQKYDDYQATDGVLFPHTFTLEGMAPFPIEMKATEVTTNGELEDALFEVE